MSSDRNGREVDGCELNQFEKNRYFQGKLVTAGDMEAEQDYHARRLNTLARLVMGKGIVCGLGVTVEPRENRDDEIEITVRPGVAIDSCGRPIVVKNTHGKELPGPGKDRIYVHLTYKEKPMDSVPVPGSGDACEVECERNRTLEVFEVTYEETPPEEVKRVPNVDFPFGGESTSGRDSALDSDDPALVELARTYHGDYLDRCEIGDDRSVYLGEYERDGDDNWEIVTEDERTSFVYTNDMLYAALVRHVTDFDNPHEVSGGGGGIPSETLRKLERFDEEFEQFERLLEGIEIPQPSGELEQRLTALERYVMESSLRYKQMSFSNVEETFEIEIAGEIAHKTHDAIGNDTFERKDEYFRFIEKVAESERELLEELGRGATEESRQRYEDALEGLKSALESKDVLQVAAAQDALCETADLLRERILIPTPVAEATLPDLIGRPREEAEEELENRYLMYMTEEKAITDADQRARADVDEVAEQIPAAGEKVDRRYRVVRLIVRAPLSSG